MNLAFHLAKRISFKSERKFSKMIVRIAIAGIALGAMVMMLSVAIIRGFKGTIVQKLSGFSGDMQIGLYDVDVLAGNYYLVQDPTLENALRAEAQIVRSFKVINKIGLAQGVLSNQPIVLKGISDPDQFQFLLAQLIHGRRLQADSNECFVSSQLANKLQVKLNYRVQFYFAEPQLKIRKLKVVGIYETGIDEIDRAIVICPLKVVQAINDWPANKFGYYQVYLKEQSNAVEIQSEFNQLLPLNQRANLNAELYPEYYDWINLLDINAEVIIVLMLLVAGINMISAILILILERSSFIGVMKSLGASSTIIRRVFYYNAMLLIAIGLLIGNSLTLLFSYFQQRFHLIQLDPSSYYMSYVPIDLRLVDFIAINGGIVLTCLFFTWIASFLITRISPLKAIKLS